MPNASPILSGWRVLVTGGTGSIGSAVVRALLDHPVALIRVLGRSECTQIELRDRLAPDPRLEWWIGDVRDRERMRAATRGIDTIVHAAAMKHVAICEENPTEAIGTNVLGTESVLGAALAGELRRFLLISSDKAVESGGILGDTKRSAEQTLAAAHARGASASLISLRLGNVLGSRGSVLPRVLDRLRRGAPVEVVAAPATRYLLTLEDAAGFALEALASGRRGEILAPRLPAAPVGELIERWIEHCAPRLGIDPRAVERRARPLRRGEKVHESLVAATEAPRTRADPRWFRVGDVDVPGASSIPPPGSRSEDAPRLSGSEIDARIARIGIDAASHALVRGEAP